LPRKLLLILLLSQKVFLTFDTTEDYHKAEEEFRKLIDSPQWKREWHLANIWAYAFFAPLTDLNDTTVPTQEQLLNYLSIPNSPNAQLVGKADTTSLKIKFFHWFLEFPEVFASGGFDCILGNPPWELMQPEEVKFFSVIKSDIAKAGTGAKRKKMIEELRLSDFELFNDWINEKKRIESSVKFIRKSEKNFLRE